MRCVAGSIQPALVMVPGIRTDGLDTIFGHAVFILPASGFQAGKPAQGLLFRGSVGFPVGLDVVPEVAHSVQVGVAVLGDDGGDAFGMLSEKPKSDRSTVVKYVEGITLDLQLLEQPIDGPGVAVESVFKVLRRGAVAKARIVGCNHVIFLRQQGNQVAELMRRAGKAVQQQEGRGRGCFRR